MFSKSSKFSSFNYIQMLGDVLSPQATRVTLYIYMESLDSLVSRFLGIMRNSGKNRKTQSNFDMMYIQCIFKIVEEERNLSNLNHRVS